MIVVIVIAWKIEKQRNCYILKCTCGNLQRSDTFSGFATLQGTRNYRLLFHCDALTFHVFRPEKRVSRRGIRWRISVAHAKSSIFGVFDRLLGRRNGFYATIRPMNGVVGRRPRSRVQFWKLLGRGVGSEFRELRFTNWPPWNATMGKLGFCTWRYLSVKASGKRI